MQATLEPTTQQQVIRFTVFGIPQPGGSKRSVPIKRGDGSQVMRANGSPMVVVLDANPKATDWKQTVRAAARQAYQGDLLRGPLIVTMRFYVPRPKWHFGSGRNAGQIKPKAPAFPITKPDVLKLARGTEDACTNVIWADDAQTHSLILSKQYGEPARVEIEIAASAADPTTA